MSNLLYHDALSTDGGSSPFDEAILKVCCSGSIGLVSPYIGVDYLKRITGVADSWRLISDIEAWLSSLSVHARPKAWQFIRENLNKIHHCPAIHAKVIVSHKLAMFGSANFTNAGILIRTEMGILVDDLSMVGELNQWFEKLWQQTSSPTVDETSEFIKWLDEEAERSPAHRERFSLSLSGMNIRASLTKLPQTATSGNRTVDLGDVAREIIYKQDRHYTSLSQAVEAAVDSCASQGFYLRDILQYVQSTFPLARQREVYFCLLQHCANHIRSVYEIGTRNRLIVNKGKFEQSSKDPLSEALEVFDVYLFQVIRNLDFDVARDMSLEPFLFKNKVFKEHEQVLLISELISSEFLEVEDVAGRLPRYVLSESFEWMPRYKLFANAYREWQQKRTAAIGGGKIIHSSKPFTRGEEDLTTLDSVQMESDPYGESLLVPGRVSLASFLRSEKSKEDKVEIERAEKFELDRKTTIRAMDKIQAHLVKILLSGGAVATSKEVINHLGSELEVDKKFVQQLLRRKSDGTPRAVLVRNGFASINPRLDWQDLADYPLTQGVYRKFLGL